MASRSCSSSAEGSPGGGVTGHDRGSAATPSSSSDPRPTSHRHGGPMHATRNDVPEKVRQLVASGLNQLLADVADLTMQAKQAHWTVKGPNFIALHKLFDEVYEHASEWTDEIAERVAQLGGQPQGTLQAATRNTRLDA